MHKALSSPERARRRTIECASAWTLASAALAAAVFGVVRYEPVLAAYFDWPILLKLNHYVFQQPTLNRATNTITDLPILTGALLIAPLWYFWFESKSESAKAGLLLGLGAAVAAVILSCVTCCLTAIPYLGTVIMLPIFVFSRSYPLYFLEQLGLQIFPLPEPSWVAYDQWRVPR